jgi:hypothetical protein
MANSGNNGTVNIPDGRFFDAGANFLFEAGYLLV